MPGYVIHLTEAKIILDILKRKSQIKGKALNQWQEDFFYGSLLPDAGGRIQKQNSHFWSEAEIGQIIMTPDIDRFLKKYDNVWKQCPLYEGYLAHLHLDREFWKYYIKEQVEFLRTMECDEIQGFYYARPLPLEVFSQLLDEEQKA